ncbi:MAG: hypothetical protein PHI01_03070, partial [Candidatus Izemoplasmatales bacterium]|nr:hypothetical protein [Candidatus Izemoplasmatales bacterium]
MRKKILGIFFLILSFSTLVGCDILQQFITTTAQGEQTTELTDTIETTTDASTQITDSTLYQTTNFDLTTAITTNVTDITNQTTTASANPTTTITTATQNITTTTTQNITTTTTQKIYDTIAEVKAGLVGDSYTTKGTVVGLTGSGFLMEEGGSYIYVYLKAIPSQAIGDIVEVTGTTTTFGGAVQFGSDSVVTKINTITVTVPTANELAGTAITNYADDFEVGDYIEITGNLIVDGTYVNLILPDTTVKGSLQSLSTELDLSTYNGKDVIVKGYVLYVSGSTTKYLNLLVTDIEEVQAVTYDTIAEVKAGLVGDSYTTKGTVVGLTGSGFLMEEGGSYIYVYLKAIPSQAIGDIV